jgi:hydroxypyruvate reductase
MAGRREFLTSVLDAALAAVRPEAVLPPHLPPPPPGHVVILAAGKAAAAMAAVAEHHYLTHPDFDPPRVVGLAATRHGHGMPTRFVEVREAGHPLPDEASVAAAETALRMARCARADDLVLVLLSGGASANWAAPADGLTLADKQTLTRALLRAGLPIAAINTVRKHLSRIKGGRLARAAAPARLVTLAISDVPGDDPAVIGSGPTYADATSLGEARAILAQGLADGSGAMAAAQMALADAANETPKPDDPAFARASYRIIARPRDALDAAARQLAEAGYAVHDHGADGEGEARAVASRHAREVRIRHAAGERCALLSGGELTVTVRGHGRGGPNQEYALALAQELQGLSGIAVLAADTDGADGGTGTAGDPAGAFVDALTWQRMAALALNPRDYLADNNATAFFEATDSTLVTGPTRTNVNDLRVILVDPA